MFRLACLPSVGFSRRSAPTHEVPRGKPEPETASPRDKPEPETASPRDKPEPEIRCARCERDESYDLLIRAMEACVVRLEDEKSFLTSAQLSNYASILKSTSFSLMIREDVEDRRRAARETVCVGRPVDWREYLPESAAERSVRRTTS